MKKNYVIISLLLVIFVLGTIPSAGAEDSEKEARSVFVKLVQAAKSKNLPEFKSQIVPRDLQEMEKEGLVEMMMEFVAEEKPDQFQAEVKKDQVIFKRETKVDTPEEKSTQKTTVYMIKDQGKWKFGKPRNDQK